ncbi:MAG: acyl-CoA desaturase [Verrucomicrobia bacterium]|nr:acyl-CoA desaturase [Verrucomicrobiota bacterium]
MALFEPRVVDKADMVGEETIGFPEAYSLITMHLLLLTIPLVGVSAPALVVLVFTYFLRVFALTGGYHRYFSHNSYRTSRFFQFVLGFLGASAAQLGPLWWASHHRHHHNHSDQLTDVHSPRHKGLFYAHLGWLMCGKYAKADRALIKDLMAFPELRWLDRFHFVAPLTLAAVVYLVGDILRRNGFHTTGWQCVVWGFVVSTVMGYHVTFSINSVTHVFGRKRFKTDDDSRNSFLLALLTMGEGWHNNHHRYPLSARQGFFFWEVDCTYYVLLFLEKLGVIWDVRRPPAKIYEEARSGIQ